MDLRLLVVLPLVLAAATASAFQSAGCEVGRIVDGDTFYCADGRKIRLIGIDSPELRQGAAGREARDALRRLLAPGRPVRLEGDVAPRDRWGRTLAYVWSGGGLVNEAMVRQGWAVLLTVPPNVKYARRLERAQKEARAEGAGLWATGGFDCPPASYRRRECGFSRPGRGGPAADR